MNLCISTLITMFMFIKSLILIILVYIQIAMFNSKHLECQGLRVVSRLESMTVLPS
jgi:hypothetical protein